MEDFEEFDRFERYTEGKMTQEEHAYFKMRLENDLQLMEEYQLFLSVVSGIKAAGQDELKTKLKEVDRKMPGTTKRSINPMRSWIIIGSMAAGLALILGLVYLFQINQHSNTVDYAKYEINEPGLPTLMNSTSNKWDPSMTYFKEQEFQKSKDAIASLFPNILVNDTATYFTAINEYKLKQYMASISHLKEIKNGSIYFQKAEFMLALAYLKNGNKPESNTLLKTIAADPSKTYQKKAIELLAEKIW